MVPQAWKRSSKTTKTPAFFSRPTRDDVLIWLTAYKTLHTGFPCATNTCQSSYLPWRVWNGRRSSHSLASNCNKWKSHAKLLLACNLTFYIFWIEMDFPLSLITLCFLNVYMLAFIWLQYFCHYIYEPLPLRYGVFHWFYCIISCLVYVDELVFMLNRCSESLALCSFAVCLVFEINILYFMVGLLVFPKYIKKNILEI